MTAAFWPTQLVSLGIIPPTELTQILKPRIISPSAYVKRADNYVNRADTHVNRAPTYVNRADTHVNRADTYVNRADMYSNCAVVMFRHPLQASGSMFARWRWTLSEYSVNIQWTVSEHLVSIQGMFSDDFKNIFACFCFRTEEEV
jgi:hypothetical protein